MSNDKTTELKNEIAAKKVEMSTSKTTSSNAKRQAQANAKAERATQKELDSKLRNETNAAKQLAKAVAKTERSAKLETERSAKLEAETVRKAETVATKQAKQIQKLESLNAKADKRKMEISKRYSKIESLQKRITKLTAAPSVSEDSLRESFTKKENEIETNIQTIRNKKLIAIAKTEKHITKLNQSLANKYSDMNKWEALNAKDANNRATKTNNYLNKKTNSSVANKMQTTVAKLAHLNKAQTKATDIYNKLQNTIRSSIIE